MCSVHTNLFIVFFLLIVRLFKGLRDCKLALCLKSVRTCTLENVYLEFGLYFRDREKTIRYILVLQFSTKTILQLLPITP